MSESGTEHNEGLASVDVWANEETAVREIRESHKITPFSEMIVGDARAFLMGAGHDDPSPFEILYFSADSFRKAGFTHFALELRQEVQPVFDRVNQGEDVSDEDINRVFRGSNNKISPANQWTIYGADIVKQFASKGIKFAAIDTNVSPEFPIATEDNFDPDDPESIKKVELSLAKYFQEFKEAMDRHESDQEPRENLLFNNFQSLLTDPQNKILGLFGKLHVHKNYSLDMEGKVPSVASRLARAGVPIKTALFLGGSGSAKHWDTQAARFNGLVKKAGMDGEEFIMNMDKYNNPQNKFVPYGPRNTNFIIHSSTR